MAFEDKLVFACVIILSSMITIKVGTALSKCLLYEMCQEDHPDSQKQEEKDVLKEQCARIVDSKFINGECYLILKVKGQEDHPDSQKQEEKDVLKEQCARIEGSKFIDGKCYSILNQLTGQRTR